MNYPELHLNKLQYENVQMPDFKAALIDIFMLTMDQIEMCGVKCITFNDKRLLFPLALHSILAFFSPLFRFYSPPILMFPLVSLLSSLIILKTIGHCK